MQCVLAPSTDTVSGLLTPLIELLRTNFRGGLLTKQKLVEGYLEKDSFDVSRAKVLSEFPG